ncbi:MAG: hypothetical protein PHQ00_05855, partial [Phycisphaerae bacterium]|nr:hypothetical protein [Phycisphaerae bacterium]
MLSLLVIISELFLSALYASINSYELAVSLFPPAGLFGLIFVAWFEQKWWVQICSAIFLGLLADTNSGAPVGTYLIAYLALFFIVVLVKPLMPKLDAKFFVLTVIPALALVELIAAGVYLAVITDISIENYNISWYCFLTSLLLSLPVFILFSRYRVWLKKE